MLLNLTEKAEILERLNGPGPFTVFAPTDAAFAKKKNKEEKNSMPIEKLKQVRHKGTV